MGGASIASAGEGYVTIQYCQGQARESVQSRLAWIFARSWGSLGGRVEERERPATASH